MTKINFIFPIAGEGSRFRELGINVPKPLLKIDDKCFFEIAALNLNQYVRECTLNFVTRKQLDDEFGIVGNVKKVFPQAKFVVLPAITQGTAETVYEGLKEIKSLAGPIVIADCDQWIGGEGLIQMFSSLEKNPIDICFPTFKADSENYSYVQYDENSTIKNIVEKKVVSSNAVSGCYAFKNVSLFVDLYSSVTKWGKEKYMSQVVSRGIELGYSAKDYKLSTHVSFGTPEEMSLAVKNRSLLEWLKKI